MHVVTAVVGLLLAAPAAPPKAPRDVSDFYEVLAHDKQLDAVLTRSGGVWKYARESEGDQVEGKGKPLVDGRNGFMRYEYSLGADHRKVELALFNAADGRHFIAVTTHEHTERSELDTFALYAFAGAVATDITKASAPGQLTLKDFLEEKFAIPEKKKVDEGLTFGLEDAALVAIHLPQEGTTVTATLELANNPPPMDGGPELLEAMQKQLKAHRKYKTIELPWSKADGKFTVGSKR